MGDRAGQDMTSPFLPPGAGKGCPGWWCSWGRCAVSVMCCVVVVCICTVVGVSACSATPVLDWTGLVRMYVGGA